MFCSGLIPPKPPPMPVIPPGVPGCLGPFAATRRESQVGVLRFGDLLQVPLRHGILDVLLRYLRQDRILNSPAASHAGCRAGPSAPGSRARGSPPNTSTGITSVAVSAVAPGPSVSASVPTSPSLAPW